MLTSKHFLLSKKLNLFKINFFIFLIFSFSNIKQTLCAVGSTFDEDTNNFCTNFPPTINDNCFKKKLIFDHKEYQAHNFAINKKGDLVIEFTESNEYDFSSSRLFYGLTKEGRYFFSNETSYTHECDIDINDEFIDYGYDDLSNSKSLFVSIKSDPNKENQYLFSINHFNFMVELHNLTNDNNSYQVWNFNQFFELDEFDYSFPYEYSLFELKKESAYIIIFVPKIYFDVEEDGENIKNVKFIKKFRFKSFDIHAYEELASITYEDYVDYFILGSFFMDDCNSLAILTFGYYPDDTALIPYEVNAFRRVTGIKKTAIETNPEYGSPVIEFNNRPKFILKFYTNNLIPLNLSKYNRINFDESLVYNNNGNIFFKAIYLKNKNVLFTHISSYENNNQLIFSLFKIDYNYGGRLVKRNNYQLYINNFDDFLNDFIKVNDKRAIFIYIDIIKEESELLRNLQDNIQRMLNIIIIDINPDYSSFAINMNTIKYLGLENYVPIRQISGIIYNDHLLFSMTYLNNERNIFGQDQTNYLSMFMIFSYPNGTDATIDISYYLDGNENYGKAEKPFIGLLYENFTNENNIFGYDRDCIKLVLIPKEILIYSKRNSYEDRILEEEEQLIQLYNDSDICLGEEIIIKENKDLIKTSQYYYIDYQYSVIEKKAAKDSLLNRRLENEDSIKRIRNLLSPSDVGTNNIFYGRTNRLKFKLCYDYCETCYELGLSEDEQKCSSCLLEYQYDYLFFTKQTDKNPNTCVPKRYYYDTDEKNIKLCNLITYDYYINITNNKKICYIKKDSNKCPDEYPIYNEDTHECFACDYERLKNHECTKEDLTMESCTQCNYECFKNEGCDFNNFDNTKDDFYQRIISGGYILDYDGGSALTISNSNGFFSQVTTAANEINSLKDATNRDFSIIDFKDCAELLKSNNNINSDEDLVILKYENNNPVSNGNEKSLQYEVYLKESNKKLDLSVCNDTKIDVYVPIELDEKTQKLYDSLKEQGYNIFDKNDKFYHDICATYTSIDGTDVILLDRINDIYEKNKLECQEGCEYSDYLPESKYLKCECNVNNEEKIETKNPKKISTKSVTNSFYNVLKYSNYKVLRCYNLVFRKITIKKNAGSILSNIYFIGYLIAFGILCYTKATYLKDEIDKLLNAENSDKNSSVLNNDNISIIKKNNKENKEEMHVENTEKNNDINEEKKEIEVIKINKKKNETKNNVRNSKVQINIDYKEYKKYLNKKIIGDKSPIKKYSSMKSKDIKTLKDNLSLNKNLGSVEGSTNKLAVYDEAQLNNINKIQSRKESYKSEKEEESKKTEKSEKGDLTDYELNELEYDEAAELDNRNFFKTYWYLLKREHIILFTFFNWNDFNLFAIKLSKLFLSVCSDMAFNVFFFSDESMHNMYESGGEYDFAGQFAQMVYSTLISQLLQIFVNYLTMTDIDYYKLKELKKDNNLNGKEALSVIKCIKIKIIVYFCSTFIFFLFFWYACAAFCAVYPNTQGVFVGDSYMSFLMGLLYPFALYLIPAGLRYLSLIAKKNKKKNLKILYSLSDKVPFF